MNLRWKSCTNKPHGEEWGTFATTIHKCFAPGPELESKFQSVVKVVFSMLILWLCGINLKNRFILYP